MAKTRTILRILKSRPTVEGAGVHLRRGFAWGEVPLFDPFLMLDDFRQDDPDLYLPGFPWHPHRGIETITYMIRGSAEHGDSLGNKGVIGRGDVQWMTAGSGIIHQEMPKGGPDGRMGGFQLWANLPASRKMMDPRYRDVKAADIPEVVVEGGATVRIICGRAGKAAGPVRDIVIDPEYLDVAVPPGSVFNHPVKPGHTAFAYVFEGKACFAKGRNPDLTVVEGANYFDLERKPLVDEHSVVLFGDGDSIAVSTEDVPVRFLFVSGKPLGEPVAWQGPIVMNTQEELRTAFREYREGSFIKHR
ncbi:MAG: pirin family protein [Candidatus Aminicenantales bacterium]